MPEISSELQYNSNTTESTPPRDNAEELNFDVTADEPCHKKHEPMNDPLMADLP